MKPIILAVDDTPVNIDILLDSLGEAYDLSIATEGNEALEILERITPDLILLDIMMPGMSGYEVCRKIRQMESMVDVPIIFLTAKSAPADVVKGFDVGAVDYLTKPFNVAELKARVSVHLELRRNRQIILTQNQEQRELLHVLCHDLANPLSNVLNALSLVREETDDRLRNEYADLMEKSVRNGLDVINLVRAMRRLEEKPLELTSVNLRQAVEDSVSLLYHIIASKNIRLSINISRQIHIRAEKTSLVNSVINNLLTNAVKFSYKGGNVALRAWYDQPADGGSMTVTLQIEDHGIGIPEPILEHVFDVSKATNRDGTEGETGTGFGMPLVSKFMTAYNGDIQVYSQTEDENPDKHGTTVELSFRAA